jgi:hypothetical protein
MVHNKMTNQFLSFQQIMKKKGAKVMALGV